MKLLFATAGSFGLAIISMLSFALFLKMANGATYAIVPFVNEKNVGLISGIVGAGGNLGGMLFGFLFKSKSISYADAFTYIGLAVVAEIMQAHGGFVILDNSATGATLRLLFPIARQKGAAK